MHLVVAIIAAILALLRAPIPAPHATVLFGGDMMFDRTIRTTIEQKGGDFIFSCIDPALQNVDFVVANLEGPITATSSRSAGSKIASVNNYVFTFPTSTASLLFAHHIAVVNLGNNHILNFGVAGILSTEAALTAAHVQYFGDPLSATVATTSINGITLAFINYNEFSAGGAASTTVQHIHAARAAGELPIVYAHWGIEYATTSSAYSRELAHMFVDAGAAIIVGSHPHVVEDTELYRGVPIYYSLGNFIFDQYWDDAVSHGLMLQVAFTPQGVASIKEIPIELERDRRTCPIRNS